MEILIIIIILVGISIGITHLPGMSFNTRKSRLMNLYSSVISDMNIDFNDNSIGAINIIDISTSILNFTNEINDLKEIIKNKNDHEKQWLTNLIQEFTENLNLWIKRHSDELSMLDKNINKMDTPNVSEKSSLDLASDRLQEYIKIINSNL